MTRRPPRASGENCGTLPAVDHLLPGSPTARLVIRMVLAGICFVIALVLSVMPGPAFVFWLAGFVLLGFSAGQVLLSLHAVQERLHRHVPGASRLPRLHKRHIRRMLRHSWVRMVDHLSGAHERRRQARAARLAERRARRPAP